MADGHFGCHVGAALQQTDCDYGSGTVGVSFVVEGRVADRVSFNTAVNVWVSIQSVGSTDTLSSRVDK